MCNLFFNYKFHTNFLFIIFLHCWGLNCQFPIFIKWLPIIIFTPQIYSFVAIDLLPTVGGNPLWLPFFLWLVIVSAVVLGTHEGYPYDFYYAMKVVWHYYHFVVFHNFLNEWIFDFYTSLNYYNPYSLNSLFPLFKCIAKIDNSLFFELFGRVQLSVIG